MRESLKKQDFSRTPTDERSTGRRIAPAVPGGLQATVDSSPRMVAQRDRLQSLSSGVHPPVVQGQFIYDDDPIDNEKSAQKLGRQLFGKAPKAKSKIAALVALATDGEDHGTLSEHALRTMIEGEQFTLEQKGRRLHTRRNTEASYPEERSLTYQHLEQGKVNHKKRKSSNDGSDADAEEEAKPVGDFSYVDLNTILTQATAGMEPAQVTQAAETAVKKFKVRELSVDADMNPDVQLMVQHALQYQAFNHPQLKGRGKKGPTARDRKQNAFRSFELEKSKALLVQDAEDNFMHTLPPRPVEGSSSEHAFSALLDVNRPLPKSPLDGATYKAVYLSTRDILHKAYEAADAPSPNAENFFGQRLHFNHAFAQQLTEMDGSHLETTDDATEYMQTALGFPKFKTDAVESDDDMSDDESFKPQSEKMIVDEDESIFDNKPKMDLFRVALGTYSKMSSQKALVDRLDTAQQPLDEERTSTAEKRDRRHTKRRKLIDARVKWGRDKHQADFSVTRSEHDYYKKKIALMEDVEDGLWKEYFAAADEEEQKALEDQINKLSDVRETFKAFYQETPIKSLKQRRLTSTKWKVRKANKPVFGPVGSEDSLKKHLSE
ncbi:hypothetical protein [Ralstonia sp. ASV6]|uniref:hypothetical protein n=1 Tax=Ralstonia sp. ASV6 TaxID=2795124 RepID=UPI0018EC2463|nr:hypothetical protein [Ralstonia sp. ASV6]